MAFELPARETLPHLVRRALERHRPDVLTERVDGVWTPASSSRLIERVENIACAIRGNGLCAGDRVALVSHNCIDWIACAFATLFAGCVVVPIFPTQALDHTAHILRHSEAKLVFTDTQSTLEHLRASGATLPDAVVFDGSVAKALAEFEAFGAAIRAERPELPGAYEATLVPDDLAVLMYTSGTTGDPKGVMLSHDNLAFDSQSALEYGLDLTETNVVLSVLPFSHIYEHTMVYIYLLSGARYFICHDPSELLDDLRDVRPTEMTAVPRIFDRVLAGLTGQAMKAGGLQGKLLPWALSVGRDYMRARTFGSGAGAMLSWQFSIASRVVLKKVRHALGLDRMRFFTSGSAALHPDTAMTFLAIGIPIMQGYGLTETSPVTTVSCLAANEYGAVGKPIPGVEVKVAPDGEVLTRGRHVMHGYYRDPEATAAAIQDGWLHTGDVGEIDAAGFLRITDRKREVFKTSTGKFVSPARVEANLKCSVFVAQAMVIGSGRPYPAALISPNWDLLRHELALPKEATPEDLAIRDDVQQFLTAEAQKQTADLATYEQIRRIVVLPREFTIESGELSPSMKIKRRIVESRYVDAIERAYGAVLSKV